MSSIEHASGIDLAEAIRLVASVSQRAWFSAPQIILPMFNAIDWRSAALAASSAFDWAQSHKYAAIQVRDDSVRREELLAEAIRAYRLTRPSREYECTHYSEALILAGRHQEAMEQLESVAEDKRKAFWWQRRAEALAGLSREEALAAIDKAMELLTDRSLLADFCADRFRIRRSLGDVNAATDIESAIELLPSGHPYRQQLERELSEYTGAIEERG
jgi:hypothetical protein